MLAAKSTSPAAFEAGNREDRQRRARRDGGAFLRPGRGGAQGGQADPLRGAWRADELRRLPRLGRALPDRQVHRRRRRSRSSATCRPPSCGRSGSDSEARHVSIFVDLDRVRARRGGGARARVGRFHAAVRGHQRAQSRLRRSDDRVRVRRLRCSTSTGSTIWIAALAAIVAGAAAVAVSQQRRLHAVSAPRDVADRDGDRLTGDDPDPGVRHPGAGRSDERVLRDEPGRDGQGRARSS